MLGEGYVKAYRSLTRWEWYKDANTFRLFFHLLLTVNYEDKRHKGHLIKRGQRLVSQEDLAHELNLSVQNIKTATKHLKSTDELTTFQVGKCNLVTVNNYEKYQSLTDSLTVDQPIANHELTTKKESNKAIIKENTATATAREPQLQRLSRFYEGNNFGMIARSHFEDMAAYLDEGASAPLIERCMKEAVDNQRGAPTWAYAKKVIERCRKQNITTVEQFEAEKAARQCQPTPARPAPKQSTTTFSELVEKRRAHSD